jgi:ClpX C4-type zinc finger
MARASDLIKCSFCGKSHAEVRKLISAPDVYICDSCINVCNGILDKELSKDAHRRLADIRRTLNQYVIGLYRACLEWFQEHVLPKVSFLRSAHTQHEEERTPSTGSFTFRHNKRYRAEIKMGSGGGMVPNGMIAKNIQAFGFIDVSVGGSGRNRIAEGTWVHDDLRVRITTTKSEIDRSKSEFFSLAALLGGLAAAEELQRPKEIP